MRQQYCNIFTLTFLFYIICNKQAFTIDCLKTDSLINGCTIIPRAPHCHLHHGAFAPLYLLHYCILCTQCATLAPLYKVLRPHLHIEKWLQIPNYLQSLGCKVGLLIIKVLKVPFHSVSKAIGPITNLTLNEPAIRSCIKNYPQTTREFLLSK